MFGSFYPVLIYSEASFASAVSYNVVITSPSTSSDSTLATELIWLKNHN